MLVVPERRSLTFHRPRGGRLRLSPGAAKAVWAYRQDEPSALEAGGVLLGRLIVGSNDIVIDAVTEPGDGDERSRTAFWRARDRAQRRVDEAWEESGGTVQYLGEWHTHPEPSPTPSALDIVNWAAVFRRSELETDFLLFLILGTSSARCWEMMEGVSLPRECGLGESAIDKAR